jgi:hypothetical protein
VSAPTASTSRPASTTASSRRFKAATAALKVGRGTDSGVEVGPLIEAAAIEKAKEHVEDAVSKGATLTIGGKRTPWAAIFFEPTVLANCNAEMKIAHEETFGPVARSSGSRRGGGHQALANDSDVGLAGYFYARDLGRVFRVAEALEVGLIGVNDGVIATDVSPFGGVKESGLGREGSKYGIDEYPRDQVCEPRRHRQLMTGAKGGRLLHGRVPGRSVRRRPTGGSWSKRRASSAPCRSSRHLPASPCSPLREFAGVIPAFDGSLRASPCTASWSGSA